MITKSINRALSKSFIVCAFATSLHNYSPLRLKLIQQSLPHVHKYGWTDNAIHAACVQLDLSPASHRLIRPYDLITFCMRTWNSNALRKIDDTNFEGNTKIRDKVHFAIKERLSEQVEYIETWNQAMAIGVCPENINQTKNILWQYSDQVWRRCGDKSTDYNYYTKRILFNSAYAATQLHLLTDQSANKNESWRFLERRISDILELGRGVNDLKTVGGAAFDSILSLMSAFRQPPARQIKNPINEATERKKKDEQGNVSMDRQRSEPSESSK